MKWVRGAALPLAWAFAVASAHAAAVDLEVVGRDGKPLADAVVFLESDSARAASRPLAGIEIVQQNKTFLPLVTVITVGTAVSFPNRDTVRHHVYSFSAAKTFEIKLYVGTPPQPIVFDRPGIAVLGCNIHDQMIAWVVIVETPYYGKTDSAGRLRLTDVPAGAYRLRAWHPALPPGAPAVEQPLTLAADVRKRTLRLPVSSRP